MVAMMVLSAVLAAQDPSHSHVRSTEPMIRTLIEKGIAESDTFRTLVATLDQSDVVVYVDQKVTRETLGGYLSHDVLNAGGVRYLHIALNLRGGDIRLVSLLAHELQHAVEVSQDPGVRDARAVARLFLRIASRAACGHDGCSETDAALRVQDLVEADLKSTSTR